MKQYIFVLSLLGVSWLYAETVTVINNYQVRDDKKKALPLCVSMYLGFSPDASSVNATKCFPADSPFGSSIVFDKGAGCVQKLEFIVKKDGQYDPELAKKAADQYNPDLERSISLRPSGIKTPAYDTGCAGLAGSHPEWGNYVVKIIGHDGIFDHIEWCGDSCKMQEPYRKQ